MSDTPYYDPHAEADMKRLMDELLPNLHTILNDVNTYVQRGVANTQEYKGLAVRLKLWQEASMTGLTQHYHRFVSPRTHAERVRTDLNAEAESFATNITHLNRNEAIDEYVQKNVTANDENHSYKFKMMLEVLLIHAERYDPRGVTSLVDRKGPNGDPGGRGT